MRCCTFFGHRDCPDTIQPALREVLIDLIKNHKICRFYVGNHGSFDHMVDRTLRELSKNYPQIDSVVVLAYLPAKQNETDLCDGFHSVLPDGIEFVPKRYAITHRNNWMLGRADYVVTYVTRPWGGAAYFAEKAEQSEKTVIRLRDL